MINKVVVFDMDETLGCFQQLSVFYDALCKYFKGPSKILTQDEFNKLLDLYPEYLRPLIMDICKYIYNKKKKGDYKKVCIYTYLSPSWRRDSNKATATLTERFKLRTWGSFIGIVRVSSHFSRKILGKSLVSLPNTNQSES